MKNLSLLIDIDMLAGIKDPGKSPNEILNPDSESTLKKSDFVTRNPISIFSLIKNAQNEEEKKKLNQLLETLRKKLPEGFKMGAAVGEGDYFFDSVAQGLNELKDKGLITSSEVDVKSLRKSCKKYAKKELKQSNNSSWLNKALQGELEGNIGGYISRIEFTAEDIKNVSSDSEIKTLKLENAIICGRPEVEGKMLCLKYGVKIRVIKLRDDEIDGVHVSKSKVGRGNNIIYIVNYKNHFVPLLSNIEKDIKRRKKVSRKEVYCNVRVGSNSTNISQSYISTQLQDTEHSSQEQRDDYSRNVDEENRETGRKRRYSVAEKDDAPKKLRIDVNIIKEPHSDLKDEPRQNDARQTKILSHLVGLMYRLDLSVLCLLRESIYKSKYPSLSIAFEDPEIDEFSDIVLRYKNKSIHVQIESVGDNDINYAKLFINRRRSFSINNYFNSFVKHVISKPDDSSNSIEHLVVYTNAGLSLTEENKLKKGQSRNFYPFQFDSVNMEEERGILKDILFTNDDRQGCGFYQFSQNKTTRQELLKQLEFSPAMQKEIRGRKFPQEETIKKEFLDKLVFAVNQPNREEIKSIIKSEIAKDNKVQTDYTTLQERVLRHLKAPEKHKELGKLNLLMSFLHDMFRHKNITSINYENNDIDIIIHHKDKVTYIKAQNANCELFPFSLQERKNAFSINKYFDLFIEELGRDKDSIEYFVIYTNADLTEVEKLKKGKSKGVHSLKFESVDIGRKKYKILRNYSCLNENGLYRITQEETTKGKFLNLLKLPPSLQKEKEEGKLPSEEEREIKEKFLNKLIFAVNQLSEEEMNINIKNEIDKYDVPYDYEELHEIVLRWLESRPFGPITKGMMEKLFEDLKNNRPSYQKIQNKDIEKTKFAKSVVGREGTPAFKEFLDFLVKGEGREYLQVLKRKGMNIPSMSSILNRAGTKATKAFKDLYDLWFDEKGNKTQYLKTLEEKGINISSMSSILHGAGANAAKAYKDLYDLWFVEKGSKTQYLTTLEKERINLSSISSILSGAGSNAAIAFKDLYDLWFDEEGNKKQYLKTLEEKGINLANISSILHGAGANAAKAFKDLHDLWFDEKGSKTQYLKTLEKEEINLSNMSSILNRAGVNPTKTFKNLYDLWFDAEGDKTQYLKTLEKEGINLSNVSSILSGAGANAVKDFKDLYDLWFGEKGSKTKYLKTLEKEGINLSNMTSILSGAGTNAAKAFRSLYDLWFDEKGSKIQYLKTLEEEGINLANVSGILNGAGANAARAFKNLYDLWFDAKGTKTQYLKSLEKERISLANISGILNGAGANAARGFKDLYDLWFDAEGNKKQYLKTLGEKGTNLINISSVLSGTGANAARAFKGLYDLWFNEKGDKTQYLETLEKERINLASMSCILNGAGANATKAFKDLHNLWFDAEGNKKQYLKTLEKEGISLSNISSILGRSGTNATKAFKDLYDLWFDENGDKTQYLKTLEKEGINLSNISGILHGAGVIATRSFKDLYDLWLDAEGDKTQYLKTLKKEGINLSIVSSILSGAGANAAKAFKDLYDIWFDTIGSKTQYLITLEKEGINLSSISGILGRSGTNAAKAFKDLYDLWFDAEGNKKPYLKTLEKEVMNLPSVSSILHGAGTNAAKAFKDLYDLWFDAEGNEKLHLKHFIKKRKDKEKSFELQNLSGMLSGAGANAKDAFEKLHSVCFNEKGERTRLLDDFYNAGFEPSNLSSMLCGAGARASSILRRFHSICFDDEGGRKEFLHNFYNVGFRPGDLCSIMSGAVDSLEEFHDFCFVEETKIYVNRFVNEEKGFTLSNVSEILHGAKANICSAFKDFHDVCFNEKGERTQLFDDFYDTGFMPIDLSNIFCMAGNNAASILRNFHECCFDEKNYLSHFLAEKKVFTPKKLSKIFDRIGFNICPTFEKLHDFCFDEAGNKTNYLNNLIENNVPKKILDILYQKVRKAPSTFLDKQNISEGNKITNASLDSSNLSKQEQKFGLQQGSCKVKRKKPEGYLKQERKRAKGH